METLNEAESLVQNAEQREYSDFKETAKEALLKKVSEKLKETGYFKKLDNAKGIFEADDEDEGDDEGDDDKDLEEDEEDGDDDDEGDEEEEE